VDEPARPLDSFKEKSTMAGAAPASQQQPAHCFDPQATSR